MLLFTWLLDKKELYSFSFYFWHSKESNSKRQPVVDVMKVTLRRKLYAAGGGVKLTRVITPLDGSVGMKYGRKHVL